MQVNILAVNVHSTIGGEIEIAEMSRGKQGFWQGKFKDGCVEESEKPNLLELRKPGDWAAGQPEAEDT